MYIPSSFQRVQAATFQDKTIYLLETVETEGALGGKTKTYGEAVSGHPCNVQVVRDVQLSEQYGLVIGRDIVVTAGTLDISKDSFIRYGNDVYHVLEAPKYDAYTKLLAKLVV